MTRRNLARTLIAAAVAGSAHAAPPALQCTLAAPARVAAGQPVPLRFTLVNRGPAALQVLRWNTPFENGWFAPFVAVSFEGRPQPYRGPSLKRGDPQADQYLLLEPGAQRVAELDLALPFDLSRPGRYRVQPRLYLHDQLPAEGATLPRPRAQHQGIHLPCGSATLTVEAAAR